jgi:hypothetical protein
LTDSQSEAASRATPRPDPVAVRRGRLGGEAQAIVVLRGTTPATGNKLRRIEV